MAAHEKDDHLHLHLHMALDTVNTLQTQDITLKNLDSTSMTFAVPGYQEKMEARAVFTSPSFYTHPNGYHMVVKVRWKGFVSFSSQLEVSALILEGAYDTALKWPFKGRVNIKLLNQLADKNHITCTYYFNDGNVGSEVVTLPYISHDSLSYNSKTIQYLVNDTLYFRVSVEVDDHKPWLQCTAK